MSVEASIKAAQDALTEQEHTELHTLFQEPAILAMAPFFGSIIGYLINAGVSQEKIAKFIQLNLRAGLAAANAAMAAHDLTHSDH